MIPNQTCETECGNGQQEIQENCNPDGADGIPGNEDDEDCYVEQCDDLNTVSGDGCSDQCQIEEGWDCDGNFPTTCIRDSDDDGIDDNADNCVDVPNGQQENSDNDSYGDACDNCPNVDNQDQANADQDDLGDLCDACPLDPNNDQDEDTVCGDIDNCPEVSNEQQEDLDKRNTKEENVFKSSANLNKHQ